MSFVHAVSSLNNEFVNSSDRRLRYSCDLSSLMRNRIAAAYVATPSLRECNKSVNGDVAPTLSIMSALSLSAANSHNTPAATRYINQKEFFLMSVQQTSFYSYI